MGNLVSLDISSNSINGRACSKFRAGVPVLSPAVPFLPCMASEQATESPTNWPSTYT